MKKLFVLSSAIMCLLPAFGQTSTALMMQPVKKKYLLYFDLAKDSGIVFQLTYFMDKAGEGFHLQDMDTMYRTDVSFASYRGRKSSFEVTEDHKGYIDMPGYKPFKGKRVRMGAYPRDPEEVYEKIKNGYWWREFFKLTDEINAMFPWQHFSFRNGFHYWETLEKKDYRYNNFREIADRKIAFLRDSLVSAESQHTRTTKYITENISTIEYTVLKDSLLSLPGPSYMHAYFRILINEICLNRPGFFFRLMDDLPDLHSELILAVDRKRATMEKLRSVETDSRSKRDFFRKNY